MTIDPDRPVHVVFAAPWQSVVDEGRVSTDVEAWWTFPEPVAHGDKVIVVVEAREPTIVGVAALEMPHDGSWELTYEQSERRLFGGVPTAAVAKRVGFGFSIEPRTLHRTEGDAILQAIADEASYPTPWYELPNPCTDGEQSDVTQEGRLWGCTGCDREWDEGFGPRFQSHTGPGWPFDADESVVVCPTCHDILHQPLGPTVDELLFHHRPSCPNCHEKRTYKVIVGMPPSEPPYGTVSHGCVFTGQPAQFTCRACYHEW